MRRGVCCSSRLEKRWPPLCPGVKNFGPSYPQEFFEAVRSAPPLPSRLSKSRTLAALHQIKLLAFPQSAVILSHMRNFVLTWSVMFALVASLFIVSDYFVDKKAHADPNTAPFNVGQSSYTTASLTISTATVVLARNSSRAGLLIQNNGAASVVLKFGSVPANATDGIVLTAGQILNINPPPVDAIYGQSASGTQKVVLIEFVK